MTAIPTPSESANVPGPLAGLRVLEFSHMVMGPSCGMVGEQGLEILREAGVGEADVSALLAEGTLVVRKPLAQAAE